MEFGAHLPLIDFSGNGFSLADLGTYAKRADELGYTFLCANLSGVVLYPEASHPSP